MEVARSIVAKWLWMNWPIERQNRACNRQWRRLNMHGDDKLRKRLAHAGYFQINLGGFKEKFHLTILEKTSTRVTQHLIFYLACIFRIFCSSWTNSAWSFPRHSPVPLIYRIMMLASVWTYQLTSFSAVTLLRRNNCSTSIWKFLGDGCHLLFYIRPHYSWNDRC